MFIFIFIIVGVFGIILIIGCLGKIVFNFCKGMLVIIEISKGRVVIIFCLFFSFDIILLNVWGLIVSNKVFVVFFIIR